MTEEQRKAHEEIAQEFTNRYPTTLNSLNNYFDTNELGLYADDPDVVEWAGHACRWFDLARTASCDAIRRDCLGHAEVSLSFLPTGIARKIRERFPQS